MRPRHSVNDHAVKRAFGLCLLGASVVLLAQACGSEDGKKNAPNRFNPNDGGENAGGQANAGGTESSGTAGSSGSGATSGNGAGGDPTPGGGTTGMTGDGGMSSEGGSTMTGEGGLSGMPGDSCEPGFGNCDADPDCEQNFNLVTSCGACDKTCNSTQATIACEDEACVIKSCNAGYGDCANGAEDGCETALNNNAANCGACGRDCAALGSTCSVDKCNEIPLQNGQSFGYHSWAYSPHGLLWVGYYNYTLVRYPLNGDPKQTIWDAPGKANVDLGGGLVVVGDEVYWSELGTGGNDFTSAVYKKSITAPADQLPTLAFAPEWKPIFLRRQGNALYWFSGDYQSGEMYAYAYTRALSAPLNDAGTKIVNVDQGAHDNMEDFNVTSDALYWVSNQANTGTAYELRTTPLSGGTPTAVPPVSAAYPTTAVSNYYGQVNLQVVGATVYFNRDANDAADGIYSYKAGDAAPTQIVLGDNITSMVVDGDYVYYARQNIAGLYRARLTGSAGTLIADDYFTRVIAADAQYLYAMNGTALFKIIK